MLTCSAPYKQNHKQNRKRSLHSRLASAIIYTLMIICLSSCASPKRSEIMEKGSTIHDPYEGYNRAISSFNQKFDNIVINPAIKGYRAATPAPVRQGIRNFMNNLGAPAILINQILQGDVKGAENVIVRTVVNTTIGIGGIFDVAAYEGIPYEPEDFGQTLAIWGVENGPYIVVPFIGASTLRDYAGYFVDSFIDPLGYYTSNIDKEELGYIKTGVSFFLLKESFYDTMSELERSSFDYYTVMRSSYYQYRKSLIFDLSTSMRKTSKSYEDLPDMPDFDDQE